ncbi:hypothetical protein GCM10007940_34820 [Portibacter lacus]|uniref:Rhamnogalacturonase A/B/Epimerase-like pectate lyase domain-containing protein n=1 Tax=Portibacter lacus TaxID=1099794 RepID=A0AA37WEK7_9BACT|nr:hypothetical protein GCM10007940_34820 [Portibacter lacus]
MYQVSSDTFKSYLVTPQQFGAIGDGKNDDGGALQKAVDFCIVNKKKLYIPTGTYRTTKSLIISGKLVLEGESRDGSYIWYDPAGKESLWIIDANRESEGLNISNIKFGLRGFGVGKNDIHCFIVKNSRIARWTFSNLEFFGFTGYGLYLTGKDTYGQNLAFRDLSFYRMGGMIGQNNDRGINNWWTNLVIFENIHLDAYSGHSINLQSPQQYIFDMRGWRMVNITNLLIEGSIKPGANIKASVRLGGGYTSKGSNYIGLGNVIILGYWEEFSSKNKPAFSFEINEGVSFIEIKDIQARKFQINADALSLNIDGIRLHGLNTKDRFEVNGNAKVVLNNVLNSMDGTVNLSHRGNSNIEIQSVINKFN